MAKKGFGSFLATVAFIGAAAAGISYYLQNKKTQDEIDSNTESSDDECNEFEEETFEPVQEENSERKYVSLKSNKDDLVAAAKETFQTARNMAAPAAGVLKETGKILGEKAAAAGSVIAGKYSEFKDRYGDKIEETIDDATFTAADKIHVVRDQAENIAADAKETIITKINDLRESIDPSETACEETVICEEAAGEVSAPAEAAETIETAEPAAAVETAESKTVE